MPKYDNCPKCGNRKRNVSVTCMDCYKKQDKSGNKNNNWRHGHSPKEKVSPTYMSWMGMIQRCNDPKNKHFHDYGGRGITVCESWCTFKKFLFDMGERPKGKTIDRIDNNKGYCYANCKWSTMSEQALNRRPKKLTT